MGRHAVQRKASGIKEGMWCMERQVVLYKRRQEIEGKAGSIREGIRAVSQPY